MAEIELRELRDGDLRELQGLIERCSDYYEIATGSPPGPAEARTLFSALPDGRGYEDKLLLWVAANGRLIGVVDVIRGWPQPGTWIIGLLLLEPGSRRGGVGSSIVGSLERRALAEGGEWMRVAVVARNQVALAFWRRLGYGEVSPEEPVGELIRLSKALTGPTRRGAPG